MEDTSHPTLSWTVHPAEKKPLKAALALMVIAMIGGGLYQITGTLLYSAIATGILLLTLTPFFLPARYSMDSERITCRRGLSTRVLSWKEIAQISIRPGVVYLSPHKERSYHEKRSILILCPDNHREVVDYIEKVR